MPAAFSFESDLGKWLVRDSDRVGDYLSCYVYDEADPTIVKTICIFFDTQPKQMTLKVSRNLNVPAGTGDLRQAFAGLQAHALNDLLPRIGARNIQPSDFEK